MRGVAARCGTQLRCTRLLCQLRWCFGSLQKGRSADQELDFPTPPFNVTLNWPHTGGRRRLVPGLEVRGERDPLALHALASRARGIHRARALKVALALSLARARVVGGGAVARRGLTVVGGVVVGRRGRAAPPLPLRRGVPGAAAAVASVVLVAQPPQMGPLLSRGPGRRSPYGLVVRELAQMAITLSGRGRRGSVCGTSLVGISRRLVTQHREHAVQHDARGALAEPAARVRAVSHTFFRRSFAARGPNTGPRRRRALVHTRQACGCGRHLVEQAARVRAARVVHAPACDTTYYIALHRIPLTPRGVTLRQAAGTTFPALPTTKNRASAGTPTILRSKRPLAMTMTRRCGAGRAHAPVLQLRYNHSTSMTTTRRCGAGRAHAPVLQLRYNHSTSMTTTRRRGAGRAHATAIL